MDYIQVLSDSNAERAVLRCNGTGLHVECISGIGWLFELRIDEVNSSHPRQQQLMDGYDHQRAVVTIDETETALILGASGSVVAFNRADGSFFISEGERKIFESLDEPLLFAAEPVMEYENVSSKYFADLLATNPPPLPEYPKKYETMKVRLRFRRPHGPMLGLAGSSGELDRGGYRFELYNTDRAPHIPDRAPLYQSWPILFMRSVEGEGWTAIFWDNHSRTIVDCGDYQHSVMSFESAWGNARFVVMTGSSLTEVSQKLQKFLGKAALPPAWAFGYHQSRWSYRSTNEVRNVVKEFRSNQIPLDAIHFDIDYMDDFKIFTSHREHFVDLPQCVRDLNESGVKSVAIIDPGVKQSDEYSVYNELMESRRFLRTTDGSPLIVTAWPGKCILPDFSDPDTRAWWSDRQRAWLKETGIAGVWNDMNEPSNWEGGNRVVAAAFSKDGLWAHRFNLYGYFMAQASSMGFVDPTEYERSFVITRSGYPGVQRYSIVWHGDNCSWWEHLPLALETAIAYSMCGAVFTGPDIPGFSGNAPDDLAVRFFQLGAFLPFFRGHSAVFAEPKEPYRYKGEARRAIIDAIRTRYSLMREFYSGMERCCREGLPSMTPIIREEDTLVADEYLLFDKFLIAPVMHRAQRERAVYLPAGRWYKLGDTASAIEGGQAILFPVTLDSIPVFVREGSLVVRNDPQRNVVDTLTAPERYEIYPASDGRASTYWFDDLNGSSVRRVIEADGDQIRSADL